MQWLYESLHHATFCHSIFNPWSIYYSLVKRRIYEIMVTYHYTQYYRGHSLRRSRSPFRTWFWRATPRNSRPATINTSNAPILCNTTKNARRIRSSGSHWPYACQIGCWLEVTIHFMAWMDSGQGWVKDSSIVNTFGQSVDAENSASRRLCGNEASCRTFASGK